MSRPRLLFLSPRFLFPLDQGGRIRTAGILRAMKGGAFEIMLASPVSPDAQRFGAEIESVCDRFIAWPWPRRAATARVAMLVGRLPVAVASDISEEGRRVVTEALGRADVLVADFPHSAVLLDRVPERSLIFTHNVEAEIFERHAKVARWPMRLVWASQARKMRRFEGETMRRFATAIAVSARDAEALARDYDHPRVRSIPTGVDLEFHTYSDPAATVPADGGAVVFSGAMDWPANIDGLRFLMAEVWPIVRARRPNVRGIGVGRNPSEALRAQGAKVGWSFTGYVDDVRPHVRAADVSVIPLRVGSGTRLKAFEAMASGRPMVSTTLGVEGLNVTPGEHLLVADDAAAFAAAILRLLDDDALRLGTARAARALVEAKFGWNVVARAFEAICQETLEA